MGGYCTFSGKLFEAVHGTNRFSLPSKKGGIRPLIDAISVQNIKFLGITLEFDALKLKNPAG